MVLVASPGPSLQLHAAEYPRRILGCGTLVARRLRLPLGTPMDAAAELACTTALRRQGAVSFTAGGPLAALPARIAVALTRTGCPPSWVEAAIPARQLHAPAVETLVALCGLRDLGVALVCDGFGVPLLPRLGMLPLSGVLLSPVLLDDSTPAELTLAIDHAAAHQLRITATGIATERERALLSGLGCHDGEGPLFGSCAHRRPSLTVVRSPVPEPAAA